MMKNTAADLIRTAIIDLIDLVHTSHSDHDDAEDPRLEPWANATDLAPTR